MNLNSNYAFITAKELTIVAMQNHLIASSQSPSIAAKNVMDFFNTTYDSLSSVEKSDQN